MSGPRFFNRGAMTFAAIHLPALRPGDALRIKLLGAALGQHIEAGDLPVTQARRQPFRPIAVTWWPCGHVPLLKRLFGRPRVLREPLRRIRDGGRHG